MVEREYPLPPEAEHLVARREGALDNLIGIAQLDPVLLELVLIQHFQRAIQVTSNVDVQVNLPKRLSIESGWHRYVGIPEVGDDGVLA